MPVVIAGLFFVFIFITGFWVRGAGKPYSPIRMNIHKLIGLAALVYLGVIVYQNGRLTGLEISSIGIAALLFVATIVTGGLTSIDRPWPAAVPVLHKVLPYLTALSTAASLYLLFLQI